MNIIPTHTLDVDTVNGWIRLELTDDQAATLAAELLTVVNPDTKLRATAANAWTVQ